MQEDRLQGLLALRNVNQGWTPESRRVYFKALQEAASFVGGEGLPAFLGRLRADAVATLGADERLQFADLLAAPKQADEPLPPSRPKVQTWTLEDVPLLAVKDSGLGNAERGARVFRDALCSRCHRAGLSGPAVGPDLTFAARRFSRSDMLESIIAPSRSVAENYRNVIVVTEAGKVHVGRLLNAGDFRSEKLKLNIDSLRPGQITEIDKKEVVEQRLHDTSPMPQGLLDTFTRDEIADFAGVSGGRPSQREVVTSSGSWFSIKTGTRMMWLTPTTGRPPLNSPVNGGQDASGDFQKMVSIFAHIGLLCVRSARDNGSKADGGSGAACRQSSRSRRERQDQCLTPFNHVEWGSYPGCHLSANSAGF